MSPKAIYPPEIATDSNGNPNPHIVQIQIAIGFIQYTPNVNLICPRCQNEYGANFEKMHIMVNRMCSPCCKEHNSDVLGNFLFGMSDEE